ncbi:MAG: carbohydrate ABC transporter substrate-binding protein [Clostridia bacterium]|nr:carbohydrate ABC transporter substrate-binding protein [Clostridia bacterium]
MKKILTKVMAVLCAATACMPFAACSDGVKIDKTKTQLYVSLFNGGVGRNWLDAHIERFQEDYADVEFTPGKKGVQIIVSPHKKGMTEIGPKMAKAKEEVYFLEKINYHDEIAQGRFLDITDMVTEKLTEFGEDGTIEDKLYPSQQEYYKVNGRYYGLPHAQSPTLITYDADLFDLKSLYLDKSGRPNKKSTDKGELSLGVDGVEGTYDDGLPATYEEFFNLCATMKKRGVDPIIWSGMYEWYTTRFAKQLRADFDGEEATVPYTFNGTMSHIVDTIDSNGNITYKDPVTITEQNGYEALSSASYYYAFKFLEEMYKGGYYSKHSIDGNVSHSAAHAYFLKSRFTSATDIAMLIEGLYWVNEASPAFKSMASYQGSSLQERNLRVMPLPKATAEQVGEQTTIVDSLNQLAFISAYIDEDKKELATTFLQYCTTQKSLEEFLVKTGLTRNFKVDYSNIYDDLCPYSQSVVDLLSSCNYIMPASASPIFQKNYDAFYATYELGTTAYSEPINAIRAKISAVDFFNQFRGKYNADSWQTVIA